MVNINLDMATEFYVEPDSTDQTDPSPNLDGVIPEDSTYSELDLGSSLAETKYEGNINKATKMARIVSIALSASAITIITYSYIIEAVSAATPTLTGLYSDSALYQINDLGTHKTLSYEFQVKYNVVTTLYVYVEAGGEISFEHQYSLATQLDEEVPERTFGSGNYYYQNISGESAYSFPEAYAGRYSFTIKADYGYGVSTLYENEGNIE